MRDNTLILYTTLGCHLCEQAKDRLWPALSSGGWRLEEVDIADSDDLVERYGVRIPVVVRAGSQEELDWPFDERQLAQWLSD
ncbi:glutaredoxin family protein [Marinimicrobium agarilyticum]|uniref:glutaredoxin family protein n=1 Tax=Marinimicrobium agarilyticum TaxID=306546 RepID=UPI0004836A01|nr:glutaredoxin family protein [Marinimicrobium agarilyticum]